MRSDAMRLGLILLPLVACGSSSTPAPDASDDCSADPRAEQFMVNFDKHGTVGNLDFVLMTADPAPPARGDNTWLLQVNAMSAGVVGSPMTGVAMAVTPFMPDHGHGTPIPVNVTATATAGQYQLAPINMWMPGYWETTIQAQAGTTTDTVVFKFCIPN
jgi:hypothetical protein